MRAYDDSHFDASSPVGQYWLTNGAGFAVCRSDGRKLGAVVHVVVDRRRQIAERLIVRRPGLLRRPRYVAIDPRAVESVNPDSQLFLVPALGGGTPAAGRTRGVHALAATASARSAVRSAWAALRPILGELDRRLGVAVAIALRAARRGANAGCDGAVRTSRWARLEAPRLAAWLSDRALEVAVETLALLRFFGVTTRAAARLLAELAVPAAVLAVAAWRRALARLQQPSEPPVQERPEPPAPDPREWRRDADAPIARERRADASRRADRRARRR